MADEHLADDVTGEGAAWDGAFQGAETDQHARGSTARRAYDEASTVAVFKTVRETATTLTSLLLGR
jgi:hypothetical protein